MWSPALFSLMFYSEPYVPGAMHFYKTQTSALAIGRRRGKRAGDELCSLSSLSLVPLPPGFCPAHSPLPTTPAKWQSREMFCLWDLSQDERGGRRDLFVSQDRWDPGALDTSVHLGMKTLGGQIPSFFSSLVLSFCPQYQVRCQAGD